MGLFSLASRAAGQAGMANTLSQEDIGQIIEAFKEPIKLMIQEEMSAAGVGAAPAAGDELDEGDVALDEDLGDDELLDDGLDADQPPPEPGTGNMGLEGGPHDAVAGDEDEDLEGLLGDEEGGEELLDIDDLLPPDLMGDDEEGGLDEAEAEDGAAEADDDADYAAPSDMEDDEDEDQRRFCKQYGKRFFDKYMRDKSYQGRAQKYMEGMDSSDAAMLYQYAKSSDCDPEEKEFYCKLTGKNFDDNEDQEEDEEMSEESKSRYYKQERDTVSAKYSKLRGEHESLKQRYSKLEAEHNEAQLEVADLRNAAFAEEREKFFYQKKNEGVVLDIEQEMEDSKEFTRDEWERHQKVVSEKYQKVNSGDFIPTENNESPNRFLSADAGDENKEALKYAKTITQANNKLRGRKDNPHFNYAKLRDYVHKNKIEDPAEFDEEDFVRNHCLRNGRAVARA